MEEENGHLPSPKKQSKEDSVSTVNRRGNKSYSPAKERKLSPVAQINMLKKASKKTSSTAANNARKPPKSPSFCEPAYRELRKTVRADQGRLDMNIFMKSPKDVIPKPKKVESSAKLRLSNVERDDRVSLNLGAKRNDLKKQQHNHLSDENKERDVSKFIADQQCRLLGESSKQVKKISEFQNMRIKTLGGKSNTVISSFKKSSECNSPSSRLPLTFYKDLGSPKLKIKVDEVLGTQESNQSIVSQEKLKLPAKKKEAGSKAWPSNGPSGGTMYSTSPKNLIASERVKKNKRTPALGDTLNFSRAKGGRTKELSDSNLRKTDGKQDKNKATIKKDYEINDMHKIISFLGKDKVLQSGKQELKDKLKRFRNDFKQSEVMPNDNEEHIAHIDVKMTIGSLTSSRYRIVRCRKVRYQ